MELITGVDLSKKSLPDTLAKEIELKKKKLLKENGSINVLGLVNKPSTKDSKQTKSKEMNDKILIEMVQQYCKKVGQRAGGIKFYSELKSDMTNRNINIGRDKFYRFLRTNNLLVPKRKSYHVTTDSNHHFRKYKT